MRQPVAFCYGFSQACAVGAEAASPRREALILAGVALTSLPVLLFFYGRSGAATWGGMLVMLPLVRRSVRAIQPPRFPWPALPLAHLPVGMLFACGVFVVAAAVSKLMDTPAPPLLAEVRRGLVLYAAIVAMLLLFRRGSEPRRSKSQA